MKALYILACLSVTAVTAARQPTLPELARQSAPNPVTIERAIELVPETLPVLVANSDLVLVGAVRQERVYMSDDQLALYTDYVVTPHEIIISRGTQNTVAPGQTSDIRVTVWGGRTVINGVPVEMTAREMPPFEETSELLLFLKRKEGQAGFQLTSSAVGAFGVRDGRLQPFIKHPLLDTIALQPLEEIRRRIVTASGR